MRTWSGGLNKATKPSHKKAGSRNNSSDTPRTKACITLPFVDGLSQKLRRIFKEFRIQVGFKPHQILRKILVHPKDPVPKGKKCDLVYKVECKDQDCLATYIGETSQPLKDRFAQHRRASTNSAVFDHQQSTGHTFDIEDVKILDREPRWFERGVRESIHERKESPALNKKGGLRHELSHCWNKCLKWLWMLIHAIISILQPVKTLKKKSKTIAIILDLNTPVIPVHNLMKPDGCQAKYCFNQSEYPVDRFKKSWLLWNYTWMSNLHAKAHSTVFAKWQINLHWTMEWQ